MRKDQGKGRSTYSKSASRSAPLSAPFKSTLLQGSSKRASSFFSFEKEKWLGKFSLFLTCCLIVFYFFFHPPSSSKSIEVSETKETLSSSEGDAALELRNEMLLEHIREQNETIKALEKLVFSLSIEESGPASEPLEKKLEALFQTTCPAKIFWIERKGRHLWLDKGDSHGVQEGDCVSDGAYLAGYVDRVFERYCRVHLITDPALHIAVELREADVLPEEQEAFFENSVLLEGLLQGPKGGLRLDRKLNLQGVDFISLKPDLQGEKCLGGILRTSGADQRFPAGIPVARVISYWCSPCGEKGLQAQARCELQREKVLFVTPFRQKEWAALAH